MAAVAGLGSLATTVQQSMKNLLLLCTVVLPLAGCGQKQPPAPVTNQSRFEASGFSVVFPGEPKQKSASQQTPIGAPEIVSYTYRVSSQLALLITFEEFPAAVVKDAAKTLGQSVRGAAKMQSGTVISESDTSQDGYPARAYEIDCGRIIYQGRYVLAGRRLYNIAAFVSKKLETPQPKELKTFFDSFQISK